MDRRTRLQRLLDPGHIAFFGGAGAAAAIRQCRRLGFAGPIWPVHPARSSIEGFACYPNAAALPEAPDGAFVAVPEDATVAVVADLAACGAGGAVCHASGFAEAGPSGEALQRDLVAAAGDMAVIGPNCLGVINYLDGSALWPEEHGGCRVERGVGVITQSGNIGQNLSMQRRSLPLAQLVTVGNGAVTSVSELVEAMLQDDRITAIGLYLEGIDDVGALSAAALEALRNRVPIVVLKSGSSTLGARANLGHTSSLAGSDVLSDALFARVGIGRVHDVGAFLETLKFLHVHGALTACRIASASCSGGEAALVADLAQERDVVMPPFPAATRQRLRDVLGDRVPISNPLDYRTYIWGDLDAQKECFEAFLGSGLDAHLLVLDLPRDDRCTPDAWRSTVDAFAAAHSRTRGPAGVVSMLPEGLPEDIGRRLLREGIAPMQGMRDCVEAIAVARHIGVAQRRVGTIEPLDPVDRANEARLAVGEVVDEPAGKLALAELGLDVPIGTVVRSADEARAAARELGFPLVVKAVSSAIAHKSDVGAVCVGLSDESQVHGAVTQMSGLSDRFLIERMVHGVTAELIVGVRRDPQFGLALTLGAGGVFVELVRDSGTLLFPVTRGDVAAALGSLRLWPVLSGFRGGVKFDVEAVVDAVMAIAGYAYRSANGILELEVNPLLALPDGCGAVVADVLIRRIAGHGPRVKSGSS